MSAADMAVSVISSLRVGCVLEALLGLKPSAAVRVEMVDGSRLPAGAGMSPPFGLLFCWLGRFRRSQG